MHELTSIEISRVVEGLEDRLTGSRLRKFYDLGNGTFRFLFYKKEGNVHIYCKLLKAFNETNFTEGADQATTFAMGVRKRLENATLTAIKQHNSDRIIEMEFAKEGIRLIIEMFGKGNVILINEQQKIELCYKVIRYRERSIHHGNIYAFPKGEGLPFNQISKKSVEEILEKVPTDKKLIRYLSDRINIGPLYLEDIIIRSGQDPSGFFDKKHAGKLEHEILRFFDRINEEKPILYKKNGVNVDFAIVDVERYKDAEKVEYENLDKLIDDLYLGERTQELDQEKIESAEKIKANIKIQKELAVSSLEEAEYHSKAGSRIFQDMALINSIIAYLQKNRNATIEEVRERFGDIRIKDLDLKNKKVRIELQD